MAIVSKTRKENKKQVEKLKELSGKMSKQAKELEKQQRKAVADATKIKEKVAELTSAGDLTIVPTTEAEVAIAWAVAEEVRKRLDITQIEASKVTQAVVQVIADLLLSTGRVNLPHFGTFNIVSKKERLYYNPQDRTQTKVKPAHRKIRFTPTKSLKTLKADNLI